MRYLDTVLSDRSITAVVEATPTQFHYDYVFKPLDAEKHVFAEKPLGKSRTQIEMCYEKASQNGLVLHLGFQRRYDYNFNVVKSKMESVDGVRTVKMSSRDNPQLSFDYLRISGSIFHDMLMYDFVMLIFLFGYRVP